MKNKLNKTKSNNEVLDSFMEGMQGFKGDLIAEDITTNMTIIGSAKLEQFSGNSIIVEGDLSVAGNVNGTAYVRGDIYIKGSLGETGNLIKETPGNIEIEGDLIGGVMVSERGVIKVQGDIPNAVIILNNGTLEYKNKSYIVKNGTLTIKDGNENKEVTADIKIDTVTNLLNIDFSKNPNQIIGINWFLGKNNEVMFNEDNFGGVVEIVDGVYIVSLGRYNFKEAYSEL